MTQQLRSEYYQQKVNAINSFDYSLDYEHLDLRKNPQLYKIGKGEQGVLVVQPYKSELLPHRRFKTPQIAQESAQKLYTMFLEYIDKNDFVGADMARKFIQMGYTRSRRYANHASGRKYRDNPQLATNDAEYQQKKKEIIEQEPDAMTNEKAQSANIFYQYYIMAKDNKKYIQMKEDFKKTYY